MSTVTTFDQLQDQGRQTLEQAQFWFEDTVEQASQRVRGQYERTIGTVQHLEHQARLMADRIIEQAYRQTHETVPMLVPFVERIRESIQRADDVFKEHVGVAVEALPIKEYDTLNVRSILRQLSKLDHKQLDLVARYEIANKNRITILTEIQIRQAG